MSEDNFRVSQLKEVSMKKFSLSLILIVIVSLSGLNCGGGSDGDTGDGVNSVSAQTSSDILIQPFLTGTSLSDEPQITLVENDVAEVTCDEYDDTEGGGMFVSCLNTESQTTLDVLFTCETGNIAWSHDEEGNYADTCVHVFCQDNGASATVKTCDGEDISSGSTSSSTSSDTDDDNDSASDDYCYDMSEWYGDDYTSSELEELCVEYQGGYYSNGNCCFEE